MKKVFFYFLKGILYTVPISITIYVLYSIIVKVGSLLQVLGIHIHPVIDPLLGFISVVALIILVGYLGSSIFSPLFQLFDHYLEKAPLIKTIYSSVKDLLSAFVGEKKRFNKPVLVDCGFNLERLGFVTGDDLHELGISDEKVAVYMPHSYAFSGDLFIVPKKNVRPVDASSSEVMKFIVSGGVTGGE